MPSSGTWISVAGVNLVSSNSTGTSSGSLEPISASGSGHTGAVGTSSASLELISASGFAYSGNSSDASLALIIAEGVGVTGATGTSDSQLAGIVADGTGLTGNAGSSDAALAAIAGTGEAVRWESGSMARTLQPFVRSRSAYSAPPKTLQNFTKSMTGVVGTVGSMLKTTEYLTRTMRADPPALMSKSMRFLSSVKTGLSGAVGSMSKSMQPATTAKAGYVQVTGTTAKTLGLFQKSMTGTLSSSTSYITVSMHTERQALTLYTNFPFNSFCQFGGKTYGASDAGLFELTGTTDNGVAIPAVITGGVSDFGDSHLKVVDRVHVGYRTDGEIAFSITQHDDGQTYRYPLPSNGTLGIFGRRVPFGRGLRARYFQWSVSNVNGSDMEIDSIEFSVRPYGRRIGGADA